eukprot:10877084-Karenia_brevis.AAC.1
MADACVLSCFVTERKNKMAMGAGRRHRPIFGSLEYETACLREIVVEQLHVLKAGEWRDQLVGAPSLFPEMAAAEGSSADW